MKPSVDGLEETLTTSIDQHKGRMARLGEIQAILHEQRNKMTMMAAEDRRRHRRSGSQRESKSTTTTGPTAQRSASPPLFGSTALEAPCYLCGEVIPVLDLAEHIFMCRVVLDELRVDFVRAGFSDVDAVPTLPAVPPRIPDDPFTAQAVATFAELSAAAARKSIVACPRCSRFVGTAVQMKQHFAHCNLPR